MHLCVDETTALEKVVPADKLRAMLQTQLEYYFSAWVLSYATVDFVWDLVNLQSPYLYGVRIESIAAVFDSWQKSIIRCRKSADYCQPTKLISSSYAFRNHAWLLVSGLRSHC